MGDAGTGTEDARSTRRPLRVSVAMATFNGERYVAEQVQSILDQTRVPDEIVVVDDGSIDGTPDVVETLLSEFPGTVTVLRHTSNQGLVASFEHALDAATGDVVFLSDQDDVWHAHKIETVLDAFDRRPRCALIVHDVDYCDEHLRPMGQTKLERFWTLGQDAGRHVTGMATAVRRDLLDTALPFPSDLRGNHDDWLHGVAEFFGVRYVLPTSLALYRRHEDNVTVSAINRPHFAPKRRRFGRFLARLADAVVSCPRHRARISGSLDQATTTLRWARQRSRRPSAAWSRLHGGDDAIRKLAQLERLLQARLDRLALPLWRRVLSASKAFVRGDYRAFSGLASMVQDVVCPSFRRR